jgi:hypothetical protein
MLTRSLRGTVIYVSRMQARTPAALKLYAVAERGAFIPFLRESGFRGANVEGLLARYCPASRVGDRLYADLTLSDWCAEGGGRLGLVFTPQHLALAAESDPSRRALLAQLVADRLCTPQQAACLVRWPGATPHRPNVDHGGFVLVDRWLDLKVVSCGEALSAKAYLGARARRVP